MIEKKGKHNKKDIFAVSILIVVALLLYFLFTYLSLGSAENDWDTITFVGDQNAAPVVYDESGITKGMAVDLLDELGRTIGYNVNIITLDWKEAQQKVLSGEADALLQVNRGLEREELYDFSNEIYKKEVMLLPVEKQNLRIAVKKGNLELIELINSGLKELYKQDVLYSSIDKHKEKEVIYFTERTIRNLFLYTTIIILTFVLVIPLYWVNRFRKINKRLESEVIRRTQELYRANELLHNANIELQKTTMIDGLTNIANRRSFEIALNKAWNLCKREEKFLALIMIDIDNFKACNDTYGHLIGDECLKAVAKTIEDTIKRPSDFVARFGGEEFVVLLPNTPEEGAAVVAERLRIKIKECGENKIITMPVTASLGVAALIPNEKIDSSELIKYADQALYQSKSEGRDRVSRRKVKGHQKINEC